jgi:hypothetical protein
LTDRKDTCFESKRQKPVQLPGSTFSKAGDTLVAGIGAVFNKEGAAAVGGSTLKALLNSVKDLARQEGLKKIELQAIAVVNKDLQKRLIADGWKLTKVKVLGQEVEAYAKTIELR